jgi:hypothetical protein
MVSKNIPANYREKCFVRGLENPIIVTTIIEKLLEESAVLQMRKSQSHRSQK